MAMEEAGVGMGDALQLAREGGGFGDGNGLWIFALLILLFGPNNWGNRNQGARCHVGSGDERHRHEGGLGRTGEAEEQRAPHGEEECSRIIADGAPFAIR